MNLAPGRARAQLVPGRGLTARTGRRPVSLAPSPHPKDSLDMPRKPAPVIPHADTTYGDTRLRATQYEGKHGATIPDDGIVDPVAVDRFRGGDRAVRLTAREVVCVVIDEASHGSTDATIAAMFPGTVKTWAQKIRAEHGIPTRNLTRDDDSDVDMVDPDVDLDAIDALDLTEWDHAA